MHAHCPETQGALPRPARWSRASRSGLAWAAHGAACVGGSDDDEMLRPVSCPAVARGVASDTIRISYNSTVCIHVPLCIHVQLLLT